MKMINHYELKFTQRGPSLKPEDFDSIERVLELSLPPAYRNLLLECNGGKPSPAFLAGPGVGSKVNYFLSIGHDDPHRNLGNLASNLREERGLPANYLPIAFLSEETYLILDCSELRSGHLYYWFDIEKGFRINEPYFENVSKPYFSIDEMTKKLGPAKNRLDRDGMFFHLCHISTNPQNGPKTARSLVDAGYDINLVLSPYRHPIFEAIDADAYIVAETLLKLGTNSNHLDTLYDDSSVSERIETELECWQWLLETSTKNRYGTGKNTAHRHVECLRRCAELTKTPKYVEIERCLSRAT